MNTRLVVVAILLLVLTVLGLFWYQSWNGPLFHTTYNLGYEMKGFPVTEMSLTICNLTTSKTILMEGVQDNGGLWVGGEYLILTVAIHNLESYKIYFARGSDLSNAVNSYTFVLADGSGNHQVTPDYSLISTNYQQQIEWGMGIIMPNAQQVTLLEPNQTVYGYLYFAVGENYTPNQLLCIKGYYINASAKPNFAINLS
jgi:hypothetical protein